MSSKKCLTRVSSKGVLEECQVRMSQKSVKQECLTRVSSKSVLEECQVRLSYKSVKKECLTRVSSQSIKQECLTERCAILSSKGVLQECHPVCQVRVSHKWVRWKMWQIIVSVPQHSCRHSGSWASSCDVFWQGLWVGFWKLTFGYFWQNYQAKGL